MDAEVSKIGYGVLTEIAKDIYKATKHVLFKNKHWKDITKIKKLHDKILQVGSIKTIWQKDNDVYIGDFYYPSKLVTYHPHVATIPVDSLSDISKENIVIEGTVGQGKSVFLRYLCIQELSRKGSGRLPIFIELRKITAKFDLFNAINEALTSYGYDNNDVNTHDILKTDKIVLLLDAFDEVEDCSTRDLLRSIDKLAASYPNIQVIISSRPGTDAQKIPTYKVLHLKKLEDKDREPFFRKLGVKGKKLQHLLSSINTSTAEVSGILNTPLLLTLLIQVYNAEQSVPSNIPEFYEKLFTTVFSKHDKTKPGLTRLHKTQLGEFRLEELFRTFCYLVAMNGMKVSLTDTEFYTLLNQSISFLEVSCKADDFRHDIVKVACLMQEDGHFISFIHKSLVEYFSSSFIKNRNDDKVPNFYTESAKLSFSSWRRITQMLSFLSETDKYRHTKYYAIPIITSFFKSYNITEEPSEEQSRRVLLQICNERGLMITEDIDDNELSTTGWYRPSRDLPSMIPEISDIIDEIDDIATINVSENTTLEECQASILEDGTTEYNITFSKLISDVDVATYTNAIHTAIDSIATRLKKHRDFLTKQDNKNSDIYTIDPYFSSK